MNVTLATPVTAEQAYLAMLLFWDEVSQRTQSADVGAALQECKLVHGGGSVDPARIEDYLHCLARIEQGEDSKALYVEIVPIGGSKLATDRDELAHRLAQSEKFAGETSDGEPQSWATAHNILEIAESCRAILSLVKTATTDDLVDDVRDELRHVLYHIGDDKFFKVILP